MRFFKEKAKCNEWVANGSATGFEMYLSLGTRLKFSFFASFFLLERIFVFMLRDIIEKYNGVQIEPLEVYKDIFKLGQGFIQKENEPSGSFKANPIAYFKNDDEEHGHFRIMFEDRFEEIFQNELINSDFCVMNGLTYFGAKYVSAHSSKMYAMIFDLDGVSDRSLNNFFFSAFNTEFDYYPLPNYVALSGHGVHLYYVFDEPIPLYPNVKLQLKEMKYGLTRTMWNRYTSEDDKVQRQGINQPFRVLGGKTKKNAPVKRVEVYRIKQEPTTIEELNRFVSDENKVDLTQIYKDTKLTLEQAKEKYPNWYEQRIKGRQKKGHWKCKRDLYDWWIRQIKDTTNGATAGHRYFCIMVLSIYAIKCDIGREELERDAYALIPFLNNLDDKNPFTEDDVRSALECYDESYNTFPLKDIEKITAIRIERNKRNYRTQEQHLAGARAIQEINDRFNGTNWREGNGRKSKKDIVEEWRSVHPSGRKIDCERDTGLSRHTVLKWWEHGNNCSVNRIKKKGES